MRPHLLLRVFCLTGVLALSVQGTQAQVTRLGTPVVRNFTREDYRGGTQNWASSQGVDGVIWVANNQGLLEFDGLNWRLHPLPNRTILRSLVVEENGRIFAGGQGEIGVFEPGPGGRLHYRSLLPQLPESDRKFDDVWDMVSWHGQLYFLASGQVYTLPLNGDGSGSKVPAPGAANFLGTAEGRLLLHIEGTGLLERTNDAQWRHLEPATAALDEVTAVLPGSGRSLILATLKTGLFLLDSAGLKPFATADRAYHSTHRIYSAARLRDGRIAMGTSTGGLVLLSHSGEMLGRYTLRQGLQNNTVLSLMEDQSGNLWLGLDNGISMLAASSPYSRFFPDGELAGTVYAIKVFGRELYCGTNNGLYALNLDLPPDRRVFDLIPGSEGQVWNLQVIRDQLVMGHHEGAFLVQNRKLSRMAPQTGIWTFVELPPEKPGLPDRVIAGGYQGLVAFTWNQGWVYQGPVAGFGESSRFLAADNQGDLWIAHPYRGVWRGHLTGLSLETLTFLGQRQGLPSNLGIQLYAIGKDVVFSAERGTWVFNRSTGGFEPHPVLDTMMGRQEPIRRIIPTEAGDLWFAIGSEVGQIKVSDKMLYKVSQRLAFPELSGELVGGFEHIEDPMGPEVYFATDRGVIQYAPVPENAAESTVPLPRVLLRRVEATGKLDSVLYDGAGSPGGPDAQLLPARFKAFRFVFAAAEFEHPDRMTYSWMLEGFEREWSAWSENSEKEYTNLRPGTYTFLVRTRDMNGLVSEPVRYTFQIAAPWYASTLAMFLYTLLVITGLALLVVLPRRRFAKDKAEMANTQERTLREQEERHKELEATRAQEIMALRNEKLQGELTFQNGQLATTTLHLVQKNAMIVRLREELEKLETSPNPEEWRQALRQLLGILNNDERLDEDWEQFAMHFDKVHADYLARLRDRHPQLTPRDHKLCAFLRMNLSSKEIAPLLYISVRGVEISRYRLRKKLDLDAEANLTDFLLGI